ncbi:MAG: FAD-binding oxidoreductase [Chitinophagaceae bacterium]|nr:FAD-binding oxidoreductase [Chitinophagaceae bacterium]
MFSIWEKNAFLYYDYIVIGSGIVGLTTAYYLKQKHPMKSVMILERGLIPSGASTKNAGFACMGSASELMDDLRHSTTEEMVRLFLYRKNGLLRLQSILGHERMGYQANGSYELLMESDLPVLDRLEELNQILFSELKTGAFSVVPNQALACGFNPDVVKGMIQNHCEGEIDTGMMMKNLILLVMSMGVEIKTGCEVMAMEDQSKHVMVHCKNPLSSEAILFKARKLIICNNAFAASLLPEIDVMPGRGQVLMTKPVEGLRFKGIYHFNQGYYYFREYKGCILFGGGRNLDFQTEATIDFELNESIQRDLEDKLQHIILPNHTVDIEHRWTGIMAFGKTKRPIIEQHSDNVWIGVRMGGMGVAIGSEVGWSLSEKV